MKKLLFTLSILSLLALHISAKDIQSVIKNIPEDIIVGLTDGQKNQLASDTSSVLQLEASLYRSLKRMALSPKHIVVQTSDKATVQIALLPLINSSTIISVIKTVCGSVCDSQINFYTTDWQPIEEGLFPARKAQWFLKEDVDLGSDKVKNTLSALDILPVKLTYLPENDRIEVITDAKGILSTEDYESAKDFLRADNIIFTWNKTAFK